MTKPLICSIRVRDHLNSRWSHWFEGLTINHEPNDETLIIGPLSIKPPYLPADERSRGGGSPAMT